MTRVRRTHVDGREPWRIVELRCGGCQRIWLDYKWRSWMATFGAVRQGVATTPVREPEPAKLYRCPCGYSQQFVTHVLTERFRAAAAAGVERLVAGKDV